jgi:hypothetical protein
MNGNREVNNIKSEKYCKFKAVDIFKSLKQGIIPKRGGPKEEEQDINKELNNLILEDKKTEVNKVDIHAQPGYDKSIEQYMPEIKQDEIINIKPKDEIPKSRDVLKEIPKPYIPKEEPKTESKNIPKEEFKSEPKKEEKPKSISQSKRNDNINIKQSTLLSSDYQIDSSIKKLDYKLPVRFKTPDYFRLTDTIRKELDHAQREINSNKIERALSMAELALYYLNNITV